MAAALRHKNPGGSFQTLDLHPPLLRGVMGMYRTPTPVQRKSLPVALSGEDVVCMARTGSGKTAAFLIPVLNRLKEHAVTAGARGLILSPTRELAVQTERFAKQMGRHMGLRTALLTGGDGMDAQFEALAAAPDLIVATPGRLVHHLEEIAAFSLKGVEICVFDEADRLFEMGFAEQLHQILSSCPKTRQMLLFSATLPAQLVQFTRAGLQDPHLIRLDVEHKVSDELRLAFFTLRSGEKLGALLFLLREVIPADDMTIIFAPTRHHCEMLHELLDAAGFHNAVIYGSMDQDARNSNLHSFRKGITKLLLVTDVAARGIDVPLLNNVVNYSFPPTAKLFVHRVGRAARQGRSGTAFNLVETEENPYMADLLEYLNKPPKTLSQDEELREATGGRGYELNEMTPAMVHYGAMPQDVLDSETEYVRKLFDARSPTLDNLHNVCEKAMKQFRRSRPDATSKGVRGARQLATTELHPLCISKQTGATPGNADLALDQSDLLARIQGFRPNQTVFEVGSRTKAGRQLSKQAQAMHDVRKERSRSELIKRTVMNGPSLFEGAEEGGPEEDAGAEAVEQEPGEEAAQASEEATEMEATPVPQERTRRAKAAEGKVFLTAADKRRLKKVRQKKGKAAEAKLRKELEEAAKLRPKTPTAAAAEDADGGADAKSSFRSEHYIEYDRQGAEIDEATERALAIGAAAETGGKGASGMMATAFEQAMMSEDADAALKDLRKRKVMHWDKRHNRYVQTTMAELAQRKGKGAAKLRTESGALVSKRKKAAQAGSIYEKWQKSTNRRVAMVGESEDAANGTAQKIDWRNKKRGRAQFQAAKAAGKMVNAGPSKKAKSELRSAEEIAALRRKAEKQKIKNMSKGQRRSFLGKDKKSR